MELLSTSSVTFASCFSLSIRHPVFFLANLNLNEKLSVVERRLDDFTVEDAASALWALGALGYTVSLKVNAVAIQVYTVFFFFVRWSL